MQLTEHFTLEEFTSSPTARRLGIDNSLSINEASASLPCNPCVPCSKEISNSKILDNLKNLCIHVLEPLRKHINEPASLPARTYSDVLNIGLRRESAANARTTVNDQANSELATSTPAPSLRERAGGEALPLIISSGYRCPRLNAAVGGVKNSQHLTGEAADIYLPSIAQGKEWFTWMMNNLEFDQLIFEHSSRKSSSVLASAGPLPLRESGERVYWIHVSYRSGHNRQQVIHNLVKRP